MVSIFGGAALKSFIPSIPFHGKLCVVNILAAPETCLARFFFIIESICIATRNIECVCVWVDAWAEAIEKRVRLFHSLLWLIWLWVPQLV